VPEEEAPEQMAGATDEVMHEALELSFEEEVGEEWVSSHVSPTC
jgi:hypothetical protein